MGWKTFCRAITNFQDERDALDEERRKGLEAIAPYKGSNGYEQEAHDIESRYSTGMEAAKAKACAAIDAATSVMKKKASNIPATPPDADAKTILQFLKLRDHVTKAELDAVLPSMRGNAIALGVLSDIAQKNGIPNAYAASAVGVDCVRACAEVDKMRENGLAFVNREGRKKAAFIAGEYMKEHQGSIAPAPYEAKYEGDSALMAFSGLGLADVDDFKTKIGE